MSQMLKTSKLTDLASNLSQVFSEFTVQHQHISRLRFICKINLILQQKSNFSQAYEIFIGKGF